MWRSNLEDKQTVKCIKCGHKAIDPYKKPGQKYITREACASCGHINNGPTKRITLSKKGEVIKQEYVK